MRTDLDLSPPFRPMAGFGRMPGLPPHPPPCRTDEDDPPWAVE